MGENSNWLLAPFNGDIFLVDFGAKHSVGEFYGQVKNDFLGGGRSSFSTVQRSSSN